MRIPKKITPSPIIEAVAEVRFENELSSAVIFGKLYTALSKDFTETEQLPILQMPEELRNTRPEFKYAAHYRLKNDRFVVSIGQRTLSINQICTKHEYTNWAEYFAVIKRVLKEVEKAQLISQVDRTSVKYINFVEERVSKALNLELSLFKERIEDYLDLSLLFTRKLKDDMKLQVTISTNAKLEGQDFKREGPVLSLEAFKEVAKPIDSVVSEIDKLHKVAEEGFFNALQDDYINTLNPIYE